MMINPKSLLATATAALLLLSLAACGSSEDSTEPTVRSTAPLNDASDVKLNESVSVTFSEEMDVASLTPATFKVTSGSAATPVAGRVIYARSTATFWPAEHFTSSSTYTATVTTGAKSASGLAMKEQRSWKFTTGNTLAKGQPVNLGAAGSFVILAKTGVSSVPTSVVTGDVGLSPAAASYITGFSLSMDATNVYARSSQITGKVYAADYSSPSPSNMTTAVSDMELAFIDAASRAADVTELGAGNIGGMTLAPGVYKWGTGLLIPTSLTLNGTASDVWIFQVAQDLKMSSATTVTLTGGAVAKNVFWQVAGSVELGTTAHLEGVVLSQTAITLLTGASIKGRMLAQTAVAIDNSTVVQPAP